MKVHDYINNIEKNYKIERIKYKNNKLWILFRNILAFRYLASNLNKESKLNNKNNTYFGGLNFFKKVDYIFLLDNKNRRKYKGYFYDRIAEGFISQLDTSKYLILTTFNDKINKKYRKLILKREEVLSLKYVNTIISVFSKFLQNKTFEGEEIIKKIYTDNNVILDYNISFNKFLSAYYIYRLLFKIMKVKVLVTTCYHSNLYQVAAAKSLGIKVVEMQHGTISNKYVPYFFENDLDNLFKPEYLLSFGDLTNTEVANNFIKNKNIIPVGSWLLEEYIKDNDIPDFILKDREFYSKIICVSGQDSHINEFVSFLENIANKFNDILIYYVPRTISKKFKSKNIKVIVTEDIYKIIKFSDFHLTMFSTCSLESIVLGTPNIFYNYNGLANFFYERFLPNTNYSFYISKVEELENIFSLKQIEIDIVLQDKLYKKNHISNLKKFIKELDL